MKKAILASVLLFLGACSSHPNPRQQAALLNLEYQALSGPVIAYIQSPLSNKEEEDNIKHIDLIVFSWIKEATELSKKWEIGAPDVTKEQLRILFDDIYDKARTSFDTFYLSIN